MAVKKFKVTAIRTDEYIIEIDEEVYNEEWVKGFEAVFHDIENLETVARDLAFHQLRMGSEGSARFIEGYGPVLRNGKRPFSRNDFDNQGKALPEDQLERFAPGLNIIIESEDDEYDFEVKEILEEPKP